MSSSEEMQDFWADGLERGRRMLDFLTREVGSLADKSVLDLGCGLGGISISFKKECQQVISIDSDYERISRFKKRLEGENISDVFPVYADAAHLPFRNSSFDLVIINGVLEWVGFGRAVNPFFWQARALDEALRVLRKGGILYLAIENRWYPVNLVRDPHMRIPFVCVLPFAIANIISLFLVKRPYQTPVYSYRQLRNLLKDRCFSRISIYAPLIHYQYPVVIVNLEKGLRSLSSKDISRLNCEYKKMRLTRGLRLKLLFLRLIFLLHLPRAFAHSFVALAHKDSI